MRTSSWKRDERKLAERLGGERVPVNGRGETSDIDHPWLAIECKRRKQVPDWLMSAMTQARAGNRDGTKLPVVLIHQAGRHYDNAMVVMRLADFEEWFGGSNDD